MGPIIGVEVNEGVNVDVAVGVAVEITVGVGVGIGATVHPAKTVNITRKMSFFILSSLVSVKTKSIINLL